MKTYLHLKFHYNARDDNICDTFSTLDKVGTASRKPGPKKQHMGGEYITPKPDWLWCIDGHDKFCNYGIKIYASVEAYFQRIQ